MLSKQTNQSRCGLRRYGVRLHFWEGAHQFTEQDRRAEVLIGCTMYNFQLWMVNWATDPKHPY